MSTEDLTRSFDYTTDGLLQAFKPLPCLTILFHPDVSRVGDYAVLKGTQPIELSRVHLGFGKAGGAPRFLEESHISRTPLVFTHHQNGGLKIQLPKAQYRLRIDRVQAEETHTVSADDLRAGQILQLGKRVFLFLHLRRQEFEGTQSHKTHELLGYSSAIEALRVEIKRVAGLNVPVLIRGETGTGKELVARAIHGHSLRRHQVYVPVNMAAVKSTTATSELFGHVKGAFTGAARDHDGYFGQADGGTLFLDEVGELDRDVQALLLRTLESGEVQRVGASRPAVVDVRVIAATDADLEEAVGDGRFIMPLLQRLNGYAIHVPPLRERREDIPVLLVHFLKEFLIETGESIRFQRGTETDWIRPTDLAKLVNHHWPGNVRELRNMAQQIAIHSQGRPILSLPPMLQLLLSGENERSEPDNYLNASVSSPPSDNGPETIPPGEGAQWFTPPLKRNPESITDEEIKQALALHQWRLKPAAATLGIARSTLYKRVEESNIIRLATALTDQEIQQALDEHDGNVRAAAAALAVSLRGLQMRIKSQ